MSENESGEQHTWLIFPDRSFSEYISNFNDCISMYISIRYSISINIGKNSNYNNNSK